MPSMQSTAPLRGGEGTASAEQAFAQHRPLLFSLAYRMLGSVADAEDMVQEAYLRWRRAPADAPREPRSYLSAVVTRLSIDHLRSARVRREEYVGPWLPEPLLGTAGDEGADAALLAGSLSTAFLLVLERLSEVERAVFLLREVFSFEYPEVARIVGRSEAACRQLAKRARERLAGGPARFTASPEEAERIAHRFVEACARGDVDGFLPLLAAGAVARSDGGGKAVAARNPILGRERVARFLAGIARHWQHARLEVAAVNGQPGVLVWTPDGALRVITFALREGRIQDVFLMVNPDKLQRVRQR
jgi:RNA polymerase sigma-70 factor (ECF subfamily)